MTCLGKKQGQLRSIRLIDCHSAGNDENPGLADVATPWAEFFAAVRRSQPLLEEFTLEEKRTPPLTHDEQFHRPESPEFKGFVPGDDEPEDVKAVRRELEANPQRRLFTYTTLDDKYGMVFAYEEVNISAFMEGEDQKEFDLLMEMVEGNQSKRRLGH